MGVFLLFGQIEKMMQMQPKQSKQPKTQQKKALE
jgi:hypothetical protein